MAIADRWIIPLRRKEMFKSWHKQYRGNFQRKPLLKRVWSALPKYLCWKVWVARNAAIFQEQCDNPHRVAIKAHRLLNNYLQTKKDLNKNMQQLYQNEKDWLRDMLEPPSLQKQAIRSQVDKN